MKWLTLAVLMAVLSGCSTLTEYEKEDKRAQNRDKIANILNHCTRQGGLLWIDITTLNLKDKRLLRIVLPGYWNADNLPKGLTPLSVKCYSRY